jgi:hypothetical protein
MFILLLCVYNSLSLYWEEEAREFVPVLQYQKPTSVENWSNQTGRFWNT